MTHASGQGIIIRRPRLIKLLDDSDARILLLLAPAGYGKTTLARQWAREQLGPVAWVQTTLGLSDVAALALAVARALDASIGASSSLEQWAATLAPLHHDPTALAAAFRRRLDTTQSLALVVDDCHLIAKSEEAGAFLRVVADALGRLLITSRERPGWIEPRMMLYGDALELGTADLAMTPDEASGVLASVPPGVAKAVQQHSKGWPVVIGLAARTARSELPKEALTRRLYTFLAEDLLAEISAGEELLLLTMALSGTSSPSVLSDLLGPQFRKAVAAAERRGLVALNVGGSLALHPLLADHVMQRVRERGASEIDATVRGLLEQLTERALWEECLTVAQAFPETGADYAQTVLERSLDGLLASGRVATVARWVEIARQAEIDSPIIELAESEVALRRGDFETARTRAVRAAASFVNPPEVTRSLLLAAQAAHLAEDARNARDHFNDARAVAESPVDRGRALWGLFVVEYEAEGPELRASLRRFEEATDGSPEHAIRVAQGELLLGLATGRVLDALEAIEAGIALLPLCSEPLVRMSTLNEYAWILNLAGRYEEALLAAERLVAEAESYGLAFPMRHGRLAKVAALNGLRRLTEARTNISALRAALESDHDAWIETSLAIHQSRSEVARGDLERAGAVLAEPPNRRLSASLLAEHRAQRALIFAAVGDLKRAAVEAARSREMSGRVEPQTTALLAQALVAISRGNEADAHDRVETVLETGCADGLVAAARASSQLVAYVASVADFREPLRLILERSHDEPLAKAAGIVIPRTATRAGVLSRREEEIYELLAQGRTNREIAQALFISESTTKVHVRHILKKLGVRSRVEAVGAWHAKQRQS